MEIKLAEHLKIECEIPLIEVNSFKLEWKTNQHALLVIQGYVNSNIKYRKDKIYESKVKIFLEENDKAQILFNGYVTKVKTNLIGKLEKIYMEIQSGSIKLDQQKESRSFQNVKLTYADVARLVINDNKGQIICTSGLDKCIDRPLIQYEETAWEFSKRMASHLEACIIPDIETGKANLWFGMREGDTAFFAEDDYTVHIKNKEKGKEAEVSYAVESRKFYKIGDKTRFKNQKMVILEVTAIYEKGELVFRYILGKNIKNKIILQNRFCGLGLTGVVEEVWQEQVKVALDIDNGNSTGDYFYNWYPETGNALYAMPEVGARIVLYFGNEDEREGFVMHCLPNETEKSRSYKDRYVEMQNGDRMTLFEEQISFSREGVHRMTLYDANIALRSAKKLSVSAEDGVKVLGKRIVIRTPDELNIYQG